MQTAMISTAIRILIGDDHPLVTEGLSTLLSERKHLVIAGKAATGKEVLELVKTVPANVLLLDVNLPDMSGIDICLQSKKLCPELYILGLSNFSERSIILNMLHNGASGYLLKSVSIQEMVNAIEVVASGGIYLSKDAQQLLTHQEVFGPSEKPILTAREKEVLELIIQGLTSPQVATRLHISPLTVESHRKSLMQKFKANNAAVLVRKATEWGFA
ncbi:DNA-binding NarL/FixJ family response regulator [Chitinophaga terrae (ex Kim and Jung 2007)]|uniref:response regulator n=1 Tax=Chitinophaga terrae (ex Kim and Jung 2007) TaxID=408074 RepID=UPI0027831364|nr:response regulator transcription factor [Chitinophaga terrae (ex Kim and Jung 2007)]MDQ0106524.1 DNA-binding NarL/FixJ family response regulator [Chitinophaga terrae (ex Kim and Jung 2007)]